MVVEEEAVVAVAVAGRLAEATALLNTRIHLHCSCSLRERSKGPMRAAVRAHLAQAHDNGAHAHVDGHGQRARDAAERLAEAVRRISLGTELAKHLNDAHQAVG